MQVGVSESAQISMGSFSSLVTIFFFSILTIWQFAIHFGSFALAVYSTLSCIDDVIPAFAHWFDLREENEKEEREKRVKRKKNRENSARERKDFFFFFGKREKIF